MNQTDRYQVLASDPALEVVARVPQPDDSPEHQTDHSRWTMADHGLHKRIGWLCSGWLETLASLSSTSHAPALLTSQLLLRMRGRQSGFEKGLGRGRGGREVKGSEEKRSREHEEGEVCLQREY